jgi:hypothetical protein
MSTAKNSQGALKICFFITILIESGEGAGACGPFSG